MLKQNRTAILHFVSKPIRLNFIIVAYLLGAFLSLEYICPKLIFHRGFGSFFKVHLLWCHLSEAYLFMAQVFLGPYVTEFLRYL